MRLFLDDHRTPEQAGLTGDWHVVRTADEAIEMLRTGEVTEASLDHDLGHCDACTGCKGYADRACVCRCHLSGYFVVCWMETEGCWPSGGVWVHSRNPGGTFKMRRVIERHYGRAPQT